MWHGSLIPLALLKRDEEVREKVPLENEEGLGFCKKDAYLSTLHPRLLTSSSLEVDLIRILQSLEAL